MQQKGEGKKEHGRGEHQEMWHQFDCVIKLINREFAPAMDKFV
jgi:hypothetical protein